MRHQADSTIGPAVCRASSAARRTRSVTRLVLGALAFTSVCGVGGVADASVDITLDTTIDAPTVTAHNVRLIDTRTSTRLGADTVLRVPIPASVGDATTAYVSVIAVRPVANGHLTIFDCTAGATQTSTLNYRADDVMSNSAAVGITNDEICVASLVETDVVVDLFATDSVSKTQQPRRIVDSRTPLGSANVSATTVRLSPDLFGGLAVGTPVFLNVTAARVARPGHFTLQEGCQPTNSDTSTVLNFAPGRAVANFVIATVGSCISGLQWAGVKATDIVIDFTGSSDSGLMVNALIRPYRFWDTRAPRNQRLEADSPIMLYSVGFAKRTPMGNFSALSVLNVQAVQPDYSGYVTVYGCDRNTDPIPESSTTNMVADVTRAQTVLVDTSRHSNICAVASGGVDLVIDFLGGLEQPTGLGVRRETCFDPVQLSASSAPMKISGSAELELVGPEGTYHLHLVSADGIGLAVKGRTVEIGVGDPEATGTLRITGPEGKTITAEIDGQVVPIVC